MYCEKQGLRNLIVRNYKRLDNCSDDFSGLPRPNNNLVYLFEGSVDITASGEKFHFVPGDVFFISRGIKYKSEWFAEPTVNFMTIHFNFDTQNNPFRQKIIPVQKIDVADNDEVKRLFFSVFELQNSNTFEFNAAFYTLCSKTVALLDYTPLARESVIQPAIDYIEANIDKKISVAALASICCLSESRFYCCFKAETGVSPIEYKNRLCIRHTMRALTDEPNTPIEQIASDYGFESAIYFRRLFKAFTGKTPTEYRNSANLL